LFYLTTYEWSARLSLGALILTGGASSRMGEDKASADWLGRRAVDRVYDLANAVGAHLVLTVGRRHLGLHAVTEEDEGGGPVGGIVAGCAKLLSAGCERALVLAVDAPTITPTDLQALLGAKSPGAAFAHLHFPFLIFFDALPCNIGPGNSVARFLTDAHLPLLDPPKESYKRLRGANTPEEREALLSELQLEGQHKNGPSHGPIA
jgi:molybdopterin-guanine dinucleotide biosynthesis protein A